MKNTKFKNLKKIAKNMIDDFYKYGIENQWQNGSIKYTLTDLDNSCKLLVSRFKRHWKYEHTFESAIHYFPNSIRCDEFTIFMRKLDIVANKMREVQQNYV